LKTGIGTHWAGAVGEVRLRDEKLTEMDARLPAKPVNKPCTQKGIGFFWGLDTVIKKEEIQEQFAPQKKRRVTDFLSGQ